MRRLKIKRRPSVGPVVVDANTGGFITYGGTLASVLHRPRDETAPALPDEGVEFYLTLHEAPPRLTDDIYERQDTDAEAQRRITELLNEEPAPSLNDASPGEWDEAARATYRDAAARLEEIRQGTIKSADAAKERALISMRADIDALMREKQK